MWCIYVYVGRNAKIGHCSFCPSVSTLQAVLNMFLWLIFECQSISFCLCSMVLFWLCTSWGRGQSALLLWRSGNESIPILHKNGTFDPLFSLEFIRTLLTVSPPRLFSHSLSFPRQVPSSISPPSHSFLPLFAFAPLIHFQCQLLPFLCQMTLSQSLYCVCLTANEKLWRRRQGRENYEGN